MLHPLNRRELLRNAALTGLGAFVSEQAATAISASPNEKLNIACVGLGNQGKANLELVKSQNIVALCDVDDDRTAMFGAKFPAARRFADFRVMLDRMDHDCDQLGSGRTLSSQRLSQRLDTMTNHLAQVIAALLVVLLLVHTATAADSITLELSAGDVTWENAVVETALPLAMADHHHFTLTPIGTNKRIPVQVDRNASEPRLVWIMRDRLDAGTVRRYRLTPASEPTKSDYVTVADDGERLLVKVGGKRVLAYNHATVPSPDPKHPYYARSGYIHPLYNPSGQIVTDDFNPDHAHQHGIMLAWRKMTFEGRATDGWDQKAGLGKVEHAKLEAFGGGPVFGFIKSRLRHVDLTAPDGPKTALDETWYVRIYAFDDAYLFDITSTQSCASAKPVSIDKIHYGGMMIRGHSDWHDQRNFDYLTDQGKSKKDGNQTRPRWVDLFGPVAGHTTGTLIMDHKSNFRFPQPVRLHPTMPYFCFTPASADSFTIQPGEPYVSRYRFYVHDGTVDASIANRLWQQYSNSPRVQVAVSTE